MIQRLDRNGDGTIAPDEVDDRIKMFAGQRFGIDFSKPQKVAELTKRATGNRGGNEKDKGA